MLCSTTYHQWASSQAGIIRYFKALRQTLRLQTLQFVAQLKNNYKVPKWLDAKSLRE